MRKKHPVLILLSVQLLAAVAVALINPVGDYIVRTKGTEYTFDTSCVNYYGDFTNEMFVYCYIKLNDEQDRFSSHEESYALIEVGKDGLAYISDLSKTKPENGEYLGTEQKSYHYFDNFTQKIKYDVFKKSFKTDPPLFEYEVLEAGEDYTFTVKAHVYKGRSVLDEILVDGVEIEEFLLKK